MLFIMMNDTEEADDVAGWLREKYPAEFGGEKPRSFTPTSPER